MDDNEATIWELLLRQLTQEAQNDREGSQTAPLGLYPSLYPDYRSLEGLRRA